VVTSLALHHLDGPGKLALFGDVHHLLAPRGAFIIADIVEPTHPLGWRLAAREWDAAVQERSLKLDGNLHAFEYFDREHWNMYRYFDPQDIDKPSPLFHQLQWLEQVGFAGVDVFWMCAGHAIFGGWKSDQPGAGS
jgi:tRNA (cmo5U34)-methyltransferase